MSKSYKILVADDSDIYLTMIRQIFKDISDDFELITVQDGKSACEIAMKELPDLILFDIIMPEINGIEATKLIRENPSTADIPIIVFSATESLKSAYEVGADDFILKPFNQYELLIKVRSALNLVSKLNEIKEQKAKLEEQHEEVIWQRDKIADQQKDILADIRYSKRIQNAILPTKEYMKEIMPEHFILDIPRNIVSGDFYWIGQNDGKDIVVVADCTGHGISGAFMTMAGTAFLNEIMNKNDTLQANEILFKLRELVMKLLKQKGEEGEASDGIDIALIAVDKKENTLQFAGANNPFYLVHDNELLVIKGDRMPIGIHMNFTQPFTNHKFSLKKGDMIYLFSDGFADQFGGPHNKKYRYRQFQELLFANHTKPLNEQKRLMEKEFYDWKGDQDQVDDVMVLGFRY